MAWSGGSLTTQYLLCSITSSGGATWVTHRLHLALIYQRVPIRRLHALVLHRWSTSTLIVWYLFASQMAIRWPVAASLLLRHRWAFWVVHQKPNQARWRPLETPPNQGVSEPKSDCYLHCIPRPVGPRFGGGCWIQYIYGGTKSPPTRGLSYLERCVSTNVARANNYFIIVWYCYFKRHYPNVLLDRTKFWINIFRNRNGLRTEHDVEG